MTATAMPAVIKAKMFLKTTPSDSDDFLSISTTTPHSPGTDNGHPAFISHSPGFDGSNKKSNSALEAELEDEQPIRKTKVPIPGECSDLHGLYGNQGFVFSSYAVKSKVIFNFQIFASFGPQLANVTITPSG